MPGDFITARNPELDSSLPYLVRIPLGRDRIVVKVRETWPRTAKVYCHRADGWPADPDIVERQSVRSVVRRGAAIDVVLDRSRENRSQFVLTRARGREMIFWQTARTAKQARPQVSLPTARAHGAVLQILVDTGEKYPYRFSHQQATTSRRPWGRTWGSCGAPRSRRTWRTPSQRPLSIPRVRQRSPAPPRFGRGPAPRA